MLYKNDERYVLQDKEIKALKKLVGNKFPVVFKLDRGLFSQNPTRPNRTERPGGIIIPFEERVDDKESGSVKWNYCELPPIKDNGNLRYYTDGRGALFISNTKFSVTEDKIDLLYYLVHVSKCIKVHDASPYTKTPSFVLEDTHLEAKERNKEREVKAQIYGAIYGHQKLDVAEVVRMAKAFRISNAESMTDEEVRDALFNAVEARQQDRNKKDGYQSFLDLSDNKQRIEMLGLIQRGKDLGRIKYDPKPAKWYMLDENGKKTGELCSLIKGKTPDESLEFHATTNEEVMKILERGVPDEEPVES